MGTLSSLTSKTSELVVPEVFGLTKLFLYLQREVDGELWGHSVRTAHPIIPGDMNGGEAVSYTHLDVYKRQIYKYR